MVATLALPLMMAALLATVTPTVVWRSTGSVQQGDLSKYDSTLMAGGRGGVLRSRSAWLSCSHWCQHWQGHRVTAKLTLKTDDTAAGSPVGYNSSVTPFYADPVFDAAHDAEFVWHAQEQTWWVVYLQNRYNSNAKDALGQGCPLCDFTDLGMASTPDQGRTWVYRGVMTGLSVPPADRADAPFNRSQEYGGATWWRPCVFYDEATDLYHGFFVYWSETDTESDTSLAHYTSTNVSHWSFVGWVRHNTEGYDSAVTKLASGLYLLVSTGGPPLESRDLYEWVLSNSSVASSASDEGPHFARFGGALWLNVEPRCGPPATTSWDPLETGRNCRKNVAKSTDGGESWVEQTQRLFSGPGTRQYDQFWAFQGPLVPQGPGSLFVLYFTELRVNTSVEPGVSGLRSMLQVASVSLNDGVVTADRNASFHWIMTPPDSLNRDRGPIRPRTAVPPTSIAQDEAVVIAASELERWSPFWRTNGSKPTISTPSGDRLISDSWITDKWGSPLPYAAGSAASPAACIARCQAASTCTAMIFGAGRTCSSGAMLPHASLFAPNYKQVPALADAQACREVCNRDEGGCGSTVFRPAGSLAGGPCPAIVNVSTSCCYLIHDKSPMVEGGSEWSSFVSMADLPPANFSSTDGGCCHLINRAGLRNSTALRKTVSSGWSLWAEGGVAMPTTQQLFRDPAVVSKYFTSIAQSGTGISTFWKLHLSTGFGGEYGFILDGLGKIHSIVNASAGHQVAMTPLRQFLRVTPRPGR